MSFIDCEELTLMRKKISKLLTPYIEKIEKKGTKTVIVKKQVYDELSKIQDHLDEYNMLLGVKKKHDGPKILGYMTHHGFVTFKKRKQTARKKKVRKVVIRKDSRDPRILHNCITKGT